MNSGVGGAGRNRILVWGVEEPSGSTKLCQADGSGFYMNMLVTHADTAKYKTRQPNQCYHIKRANLMHLGHLLSF